MARKPDKRVYVRRNRVRRKLQLRRAQAPITKRSSNALQETNLRLLAELERQLG
ncbi:MAG: hypothetical protein NZZ60_04040 [Bacteroidia bacterium]|nr:hypothetical protein [Bacteroidia bacterium]MCX7652454.1 hypothetical protein [Bacteroidia bacterium]MDW8416855.1 hypothetical protein [Bacteroidia bacterium]